MANTKIKITLLYFETFIKTASSISSDFLFYSMYASKRC